jgi:hypothetical protein
VHATSVVLMLSCNKKPAIMKKTAILALAFSVIGALVYGQEIEKDLQSFSKIIASPRINLILTKGDKESIKIVYDEVAASKIHSEVRGNTLHIYLENAKTIEKMSARKDRHENRHGIYEGVSVTAYVTYTSLQKLQIRGKQELTVNDPIEAKRFVLKAYGENEITLASLNTEFFKASLYGENKLKVKKGKAVEQKYRLFGENKIDTRELMSEFAVANIYGEGKVQMNTTEEVVLNAFGEPRIQVAGGAFVNRRIVFGRPSILTTN